MDPNQCSPDHGLGDTCLHNPRCLEGLTVTSCTLAPERPDLGSHAKRAWQSCCLYLPTQCVVHNPDLHNITHECRSQPPKVPLTGACVYGQDPSHTLHMCGRSCPIHSNRPGLPLTASSSPCPLHTILVTDLRLIQDQRSEISLRP